MASCFSGTTRCHAICQRPKPIMNFRRHTAWFSACDQRRSRALQATCGERCGVRTGDREGAGQCLGGDGSRVALEPERPVVQLVTRYRRQ